MANHPRQYTQSLSANQLRQYTQSLSDLELADKLINAADVPRKFSAAERSELMHEASRRLHGVRSRTAHPLTHRTNPVLN